LILDVQVHTWYSDRPSRPWDPAYRETYREKQSYLQHAGQTNSPEMIETEMAEAGVDGALLTALGIYGSNIELELETAERDPRRFQVVGVVDHLADGLAEHLERAQSRGLRGVRMLEMRDPDRVARGEFDALLRACSDLHLVVVLPLVHPVNRGLVELIARYPDVFFYFNHLGTGYAPPIVGFRPEKPFEHLDAILELAGVPNIGLKLTGAPALSAERYPYRDIWPPLVTLITAFGADRISWGSDYTRTAGLCSYWEGTHYLGEIPELSQDQRDLLYAGTLQQRTGWHPDR
jgi:L-fuconolactonase